MCVSNLEKYSDNSYVCKKTRQKVLKVAKMKDANYGCKDEGNEVCYKSVSC